MSLLTEEKVCMAQPTLILVGQAPPLYLVFRWATILSFCQGTLPAIRGCPCY